MGRNKATKDKLKILYGCRDMLTGLKNKNLDYHHIIKVIDNGPRTIENGTLLERNCHQWLHYYEIIDLEMYKLINECLVLYKKCIDLEYVDLIIQYESDIFPEVINLLNEYAAGHQKKSKKQKFKV